MLRDTIKRAASLLLISILLLSDVSALARAVYVYQFNANYTVEAEAATPQITQSIEQTSTELIYKVAHKTAFIGQHHLDMVQSPTDDVFNFELDDRAGEYAFAALQYEVKGISNPGDLPVSVNQGQVYAGATLEAGSEWQSTTVMLDRSDLKNGINQVRFAVPQASGLGVEVRNVSLQLSLMPQYYRKSVKLERQSANKKDFDLLDKGLARTVETFSNRDIEMASIPTHIKNITRNAWGYGAREGATSMRKIALGVDASKLLNNNEIKEAYVFYYDAVESSWKQAHTAKVDMARMVLEANVPGNTDYFAGLIKSPDMPEAGAFLPTAMSDVKVANPATGIQLMSPPEISQTGEASISYPLNIPAGRNGMTPPIALSYSSDGGSGWAGYGWSISAPSVTIDTRWGVPTFDANLQEEVYLLNGKSLVEEDGIKANRPIIEGGVPQAITRETGNIRYFERTMSGYKEIERRGDDPKSYIWVETMANQTKYFYGTLEGSKVHDNAVLRDPDENIVTWYLARVEDQWGNQIDYKYNHYTYSGSNTLMAGGKTVVMDEVVYTGYMGTAGKYKVEFISSPDRTDASISMKYGFKVLDDRLLTKINVKYNGSQLIRSYELKYTEDKFFKKLLSKLEEYGEDGTSLFYDHDFDYYDEDLTYGTPQVIEVDHFSSNINSDFDGDLDFMEKVMNNINYPSPVKTTSSTGWNANGGLGVGLVPPFGGKLFKGKALTFSGLIGYGEGYNRDKLSLNDMNGDGIPDIVYDKKGGHGFYSLNSDGSQLSTGPFESISNVDHFFESASYNTSYGFDFSFYDNVFYFGSNWQNSKSKVKTYMIDYNADGYVDLVEEDANRKSWVRFGQINSNGQFEFASNSAATRNPVLKGAELSEDAEDEALKDVEMVKSWTAPFGGTINITGTAEMVDGLDGEVRIVVQKNNQFLQNVGFTSVTASGPVTTNYSNVSVSKGDIFMFRVRSDANGQEDLITWNPAIDYTGTHYTDGNGIDYSQSSYEDGFLLSGGQYIDMEGSQKIKVALNRSLDEALSDDLVTLLRIVETNDDDDVISTRVYASTAEQGSSGFGNDVFDLIEGSGPATINLGSPGPQTLAGSSSQYSYNLYFSMFSTSNIDWRKVSFRPVVELVDNVSCDIEQKLYPVPRMLTYNKVEHMLSKYYPSVSQIGGKPYRIIPSFNYTSSDITNVFSSLSGSTNQGKAYMTVKGEDGLLSKLQIVIDQDSRQVHLLDCDEFGEGTNNINSTTSPAIYSLNGPSFTNGMYVEFFADDELIGAEIANFLSTKLDQLQLQIYGTSWSTVQAFSGNHSIFYRERSYLGEHLLHWGQFAWSFDKTEPESSKIQPGDLEPDFITVAGDEDNQFDEEELPDQEFFANNQDDLNPINQKFFSLSPQRGEVDYMLRSYQKSSYDELEPAGLLSTTVDNSIENLDRYSFMNLHMAIYASAGMSAPGKLGEEEQKINPPGGNPDPGIYGANGMTLWSKSKSYSYTLTGSWNNQGSAGVSHAHGSENTYFSKSNSVFSDYNGDGYPDKLTDNGTDVYAHYTSPLGGHKAQASTPHTSNDLSKSYNWNVAPMYSHSFANEDSRYSKKPNANGAFGKTHQVVQSMDLNGDGLPDHVFRNEVGNDDLYTVGFGNGTGFESQASPSLGGAQMPLSNTETASLGGNLTKVKNLKNGSTKNGGSFKAGLTINMVFNEDERSFADVNGDGLVDAIIMNGNTPTLYINTGNSWQKFAQSNPAITWAKGMNESNGQGFSANVGGTYTFNIPTGAPIKLKVSISAGAAANAAINGVNSTLMDMNGDKVPDYVIEDGLGNLSVSYAQLNAHNLLKTVTNPLNGSFTISYEKVGNKVGYHSPVVKTHLNDGQKVLWDMPEGKWVMSQLEVNDGYNVVSGGTDLDGTDIIRTYYSYDGGIKSRREREFLGFTATEKKYEPFTNPEARSTTATTFGSSLWDKHFLTEVNLYMAPLQNDFQYRKRSEYQRGILKEAYVYYNIIRQVLLGYTNDLEPQPIYDYPHEIYPSSVDLYKYEFRNVNIDSKSGSINQVYSTASGNREVVWANIEETQCLFPALVEIQKIEYPDLIVVNNRNKHFSQKFTLKYDDYFNVIRYENEGKMVGRTSGTRLVESYTRYFYDYIIEEDRIVQSSEWSEELSDENYDVYILLCTVDGSYSADTIYVPKKADDCFGFTDPVVYYGDQIIVNSQHRRLINELIEVHEPYYTDLYEDKVIAIMTYHSPGDANEQTGLLKTHHIYVNDENISDNLRRRSEVASLEAGERAPDIIENYEDSDISQTDLTYDVYGNVTSVLGPVDGNSERMQVDYSYDNTLHQYLVTVTNASRVESTCNVYELKTGNLQKTVDLNGHATRYVYDKYQRLVEIWAPRQLYRANSGASATIAFEYYPHGRNTGTNAPMVETVPVAYTLHNMETVKSSNVNNTPNYQCSLSISDAALAAKTAIPNPLRTASFTDGLGRAFQTKKEASIDNGSGSNVKTRQVSGFTQYDQWGSPMKTTNSQLEGTTGDLGHLTIFSSNVDMSNHNYDYLGRTTQATQRAGTVNNGNHSWSGASTIYRLGNVDGAPMKKVRTSSTNAGVESISLSFTDSRGLQTLSRQMNSAAVKLDTKFTYDELGQLIKTTDPGTPTNPTGLETSYKYDELGRMYEEDHPDRGVTTYTFDKASNMLSKKVPKTTTSTHTINYTYKYNRLKKKTMPESNDLYKVEYFYGASNSNGVGRITSINQGDGFKIDTYKYDELGNVISETKVFDLPTHGTRDYTTLYAYDSWGRVLDMLYDDGDEVYYTYTSTGELERIYTINNTFNPVSPQSWIVIDNMTYDGFGNVSLMEYGNGAATEFTYDDKTHAIDVVVQKAVDPALATGNPVVAYEQSFTYDDGGKIGGVEHSNTSALPGSIPHDFSYTYDAFHRLTNTQGNIDGTSYNQTLTYHKDGSINSKTQTYTGNSYSLGYGYNNSGTHQLTSVDNHTYTYNASGSIETITPTGSSTPSETFVRNEEQLLVAVENNNGMHHYVYDHAGERIMKSSYTSSGTAVNGQTGATNTNVLYPYTVYVNPYMIVTPYTGLQDYWSKHYYMGSQRVATERVQYDSPASGGGRGGGEEGEVPGGEQSDPLENPVLQQLGDLLEKLGHQEGVDFKRSDFVQEHRMADFQDAVKQPSNTETEGGEGGGNSNTPVRLRYWYHPNYLGNVDMVTDMNGEVHQYFVYSSFGENLYQWDKNNDFSSRYRFNAKEEDPETGNMYYGARYYDPKISVWLSVDPMSSERASLTPYNFVQNNPIHKVDPTGMLDGDFYDENDVYLGSDGKPDDKIYVINTSDKSYQNLGTTPAKGQSRRDSRKAKDFVKTNSGNTAAFDSNPDIYDKFTELPGDKSQRNAAMDHSDNTEATTPGLEAGYEVATYTHEGKSHTRANASVGTENHATGESSASLIFGPYEGDPNWVVHLLFHSHPAKNSQGVPLNQPPSFNGDITGAQSQMRVVHARGENKVYLYNKNGVSAVMSEATFRR